MVRQWSGEVGGGKGRCVGSLWVTLGSLYVTLGYLKATVVHIRVTLGHLNRVTIGHVRVTISKHKANTTEIHPKVRQTCFSSKSFL